MICLSILACFTVAGCFGGSRGLMRFDELKFPASMSPYLYGPNEELLSKSRGLNVIKQFHHEYYYWGGFYSMAPWIYKNDFSELINNEIIAFGGDGIINMQITSQTGFTTYMHPLTLLPIWPNFTKVVLEGEIVKHESLSSGSMTKPSRIQITDDTLIMEKSDEYATIQLQEQCRRVGKIDTFFARRGSSFWPSDNPPWQTMISAETDETGRVMLIDWVKKSIRGSANVAQILYITRDTDEIRKRYDSKHQSWPFFAWEQSNAAVDVRYWNCPSGKTNGEY